MNRFDRGKRRRGSTRKTRRTVIEMSRYRVASRRRSAVMRRLMRRIPIDRRSGVDRRKSYSLDYFAKGGIERRGHQGERRQNPERRDQWIRVTDWSSVYVGDTDEDVHLS